MASCTWLSVWMQPLQFVNDYSGDVVIIITITTTLCENNIVIKYMI